VRGHLVIEEQERPGLLWSRRDYVFERKEPAASSAAPCRHERTLLDALFADGRDTVPLSALENQFYRHIPRIRDGIFMALVGRGYYAHRPDEVRTTYWILAFVVAGLGVAAAVPGEPILSRFFDLAPATVL